MTPENEGAEGGCCDPERGANQRLLIDFLYLDLDVCPRCRETELALDRAVARVRDLLRETGTEIVVNKVHVETEEKARGLGLLASPTVRVNGRDVQPELRQSRCGACSEISGEPCECRLWLHRSEVHEALPEGLVLDAILAALYGGAEAGAEPARPLPQLPENLRRFFAGKARQPRA